MSKPHYSDRELAGQVQKAKAEGANISVIVLLKGVKLKDAEKALVQMLNQVNQETGEHYVRYNMFRHMECAELECSPHYLDHLVGKDNIQAVVQNTHTSSIIQQLREG